MEATQVSVDVKLLQLNMTVAKTDTVLAAGNPEAIERQCSTLRSITAEITRMRLDVEAKKLEAKEEIADIQTWNTHLDAKLDEADNEVGKARKWLDDRKKETEVLAQEEKMRFEEKLHLKPNWNFRQNSKRRRQANTHMYKPRHRATSKPSSPNSKLPNLTALSWTGHDFGDSFQKP
ncbi:hypothetical protein OS493_030066 [Desmophyllum pertusum]|uniref:Uncharacterized protein n=1 Tax=Desmophyllum pertusum TaxID=174260 RepID=A0A9W9Z9C9_9CNID|nr:hypothetical protein OS493_030066 [Desmophyllum pertusum]